MWSNKTLFQKIALKALSPEEEPPLIEFPEVRALKTKLNTFQIFAFFKIQTEYKEECLDVPETDDSEFISPDQISHDLITLSGLPSSRWQNLLNIDLVKQRNKPKAPPKVPKAAPFFLPTVSTLTNFEFDLKNALPSEEGESKMLFPKDFNNFTAFGRKLHATRDTNDFGDCMAHLKTLGPSMVDFEIKSLAPEGGGSVELMLQFMKMIAEVLQSNKDFELAEAYMSVLLKSHGTFIAESKVLCEFLPELKNRHMAAWVPLQEDLMYTICVLKHLTNM